MNDQTASRTALAAAMMRATHTRCDQPRLIDDAWADRLVPAAEKDALHRRMLDGATPDVRARLSTLDQQRAIDVVLRAHPTYGGVVVRTRVAEDALADAVARGVGQYVLIGAGFDSFIVRQPDYARQLTIFEIDHPASQALKRQQLDACGVAVAPNVQFVAADLGREPLADVLARSRFDRARPAFFSWLGVTIYLTPDANRATLRGIAAASAAGSEVIFTYIDQRLLDARIPKLEALRAGRAAQGEPWISGFDPTTLADELRQLGLELVEDLTGALLQARYCAERDDGLSPGVAGHIARARVM